MEDLYHIAAQLGNALLQRNAKICTAESCTGGGVAYALTEVPGSSAWFEYGWVTYSNEAKREMLGIGASLLEQFGAVSEQVAISMATRALERAHADYSIAITGIAGPTGGTVEKPVGTVWIAWGSRTKMTTKCLALQGERGSIRKQSIFIALQEAYQQL